MHKPRFEDIDYLKAIAIIIVVVTHVLSYNLGPSLINTIWNYLHFVVPAFIFCSGFVSYQKYKDTVWTYGSSWQWFLKRVPRLVFPYYLVILLHYALWFLFPWVFSGSGLVKDVGFLLRSVVLIGVDYGWLPLLFIELMLITPLCLTAFRKKHTRMLSMGISFASTVILLFIHIPVDYRIIMWVPWSFILLLSFAAAEFRSNKASLLPIRTSYILGVCVSLTVWLFFDALLRFQGRQVTLTLHKYPPDLYYLSYGIGLGNLLLLLENVLSTRIQFFRNMLRWLSSYSYELFFAHYLVIDALRTIMKSTHTNIPVTYQCLIVLFVSMELVHIYTNAQKEIRKRSVVQIGK